MQRWHSLYHREYSGTIPLPTNVQWYESALPALLVDELSEQIRVTEPNVQVIGLGTSDSAKRTRDRLRMWANHTLHATASEGLNNPYAQARTDLNLRGAGCLKYIVKPEILDREQQPGESNRHYQQRRKQMADMDIDLAPFTVRAVDPLNLYPSPGTGKLRYMLERQGRRVMDIWEAFPEWSDPVANSLVRIGGEARQQASNPLREVEWLEYWSWLYSPKKDMYEGHYIIEIDGERVEDIANPYRRVPYAYRYSGMGRHNRDGDPADLAVSILAKVEGELKAEIQVMTAMGAQWMAYVFPRLKVKGISAEDAREMFMVGPGGIIEIDNVPGADVEWLESPAPNPSMTSYHDRLMEKVNRKVSPALSGGTGGTESGIQQALSIGQASKPADAPKAALSQMSAEVLEGMAALSVQFDITQNVRGTMGDAEPARRIKPTDFKQRGFSVDYEVVDPRENDRRMLALLTVARNPNLMSRETFRSEALRGIIESNDEEEARIIAENVQDQLVAAGLFTQQVIEEMGQLRQTDMENEAIEEGVRGAQSALQGDIGSTREQALERLAQGASGAIPTQGADQVLGER